MGFLQSIIGNNTGAGFRANGVTAADLSNSAQGVQASQNQQNALLSALAGQNGLGNQSQVFNQQQQLLAQQAAINGTANQQNALNSQQQLAQQQQGTLAQYQNLANGVGPNPAQAQLAQNTAANVAQTGALMAGQRGASQNVGLLARQAGMQGAATQQNAVGQAATLQAQQQLAGLQGLTGQQQAIGATNQSVAGIAANQVGQQQAQQTNAANLATQQAGQTLSASQAAANTAIGNQSNIYGLQSNINTTEAGIAAGNQKAQAGLLGGILGSAGAGSSTASGARGGVVSMADGGAITPPQVQTPNAYTGQQPNNGAQSYIGKYFSGQQGQPGGLTQDTGKSGQAMGQAAFQLGKLAYNSGKSIVQNYNKPLSKMPTNQDYYDMYHSNPNGVPTDAQYRQLYSVPNGETAGNTGATGIEGVAEDAGAAEGAGASGASAAEGAGTVAGAAEAGEAGEGADAFLALLAEGGKIQAGYSDTGADPSTLGGTLSEIMSYLGAKGGGVQNLTPGGNVKARKPSEKAVKSGDSYSNDKIHAVLSEGEVVLPRSVMMSKDPVRNAASFVQATLAKRGRKK